MLERRDLTQVTANAELADRLLATARQHLVSARLLAASDPYLAYAAVYDSIRKPCPRCCKFRGYVPRRQAGTWRSCMLCKRSSAHRWALSCARLTGSA